MDSYVLRVETLRPGYSITDTEALTDGRWALACSDAITAGNVISVTRYAIAEHGTRADPTRTTQYTSRQEHHHKRPHEEPPPPHLTTIEGSSSWHLHLNSISAADYAARSTEERRGCTPIRVKVRRVAVTGAAMRLTLTTEERGGASGLSAGGAASSATAGVAFDTARGDTLTTEERGGASGLSAGGAASSATGVGEFDTAGGTQPPLRPTGEPTPFVHTPGGISRRALDAPHASTNSPTSASALNFSTFTAPPAARTPSTTNAGVSGTGGGGGVGGGGGRGGGEGGDKGAGGEGSGVQGGGGGGGGGEGGGDGGGSNGGRDGAALCAAQQPARRASFATSLATSVEGGDGGCGGGERGAPPGGNGGREGGGESGGGAGGDDEGGGGNGDGGDGGGCGGGERGALPGGNGGREGGVEGGGRDGAVPAPRVNPPTVTLWVSARLSSFDSFGQTTLCLAAELLGRACAAALADLAAGAAPALSEPARRCLRGTLCRGGVEKGQAQRSYNAEAPTGGLTLCCGGIEKGQMHRSYNTDTVPTGAPIPRNNPTDTSTATTALATVAAVATHAGGGVGGGGLGGGTLGGDGGGGGGCDGAHGAHATSAASTASFPAFPAVPASSAFPTFPTAISEVRMSRLHSLDGAPFGSSREAPVPLKRIKSEQASSHAPLLTADGVVSREHTDAFLLDLSAAALASQTPAARLHAQV